MQFTAALRDRLVAGDPGLTRFYMAARATGAVGAALGILLAAADRFHLPLTVPLVGAALGMTWAIAVNDPSPREQRVTTVLLWLPAAAMLALGTFTARDRVVSDALFVAILFASVYVRRYGPRGFAIGMVSVLAFFFSLFLRATFEQLPWLLFALAVTTACTYVIRFFIFPDRPEYAFRNGVSAFRARQRLMSATIAQAAERGTWTRRLQRQMNHHIFRLNETAIALDDQLRDTGASEQRAAVVDAELASEEAVERAVRDPHAPVEMPLLVMDAPTEQLSEWTPRGLFRIGTQIDMGRLAPTTRQAIQLTLAAIPAIIAGDLLSAQRWYWAVLTTFVVFSGTTSAGETLRKAWSRVAGTAFGVLAGVLIALIVHNDRAAALALLFVFLFVAVYGLRLSYALMTFGITAVLSLLYVLLGFYTDQILVLRLVETVVGAAFGGAAATLVLPIHTERVVNSVIAEALSRLSAAVEQASLRLTGDEGADPIQAARAYDEAFQTVRAQLLPLIYTLRMRPDETLRTRLLLLAACGYSLRALASLANDAPPDCPADAIRTLQRHVQAQIGIAQERLADGTTPARPFEEAALAHPDSSALTHLARIDRSVHRLAMGISGAA